MTSEERHEARYQRRKKKREEKRRLKSEQCGTYNEVFTFENLYKSGKKCICFHYLASFIIKAKKSIIIFFTAEI